MPAPGLNYEVRGGRQLRKTLKAAGEDLSDLRDAHRDAARIAANAAADRAPIGPTGRLSKSIRGAGTKTAGIIRAGNNTTVPYAAPIHWGWYARHITPQPFLMEGARESEPRWVPVFERTLDAALDRIEGI